MNTRNGYKMNRIMVFIVLFWGLVGGDACAQEILCFQFSHMKAVEHKFSVGVPRIKIIQQGKREFPLIELKDPSAMLGSTVKEIMILETQA